MPERNIGINNLIKYLENYRDYRKKEFPYTCDDFYKNINKMISDLKANKLFYRANIVTCEYEIANKFIKEQSQIKKDIKLIKNILKIGE